jgi:hypothetical protein
MSVPTTRRLLPFVLGTTANGPITTARSAAAGTPAAALTVAGWFRL